MAPTMTQTAAARMSTWVFTARASFDRVAFSAGGMWAGSALITWICLLELPLFVEIECTKAPTFEILTFPSGTPVAVK